MRGRTGAQEPRFLAFYQRPCGIVPFLLFLLADPGHLPKELPHLASPGNPHNREPRPPLNHESEEGPPAPIVFPSNF